MLSERKSVGRRVAPSVYIERRTVRIVRLVASSQSCSVWALGRKSGKRLELALSASTPKRKVWPFCPGR